MDAAPPARSLAGTSPAFHAAACCALGLDHPWSTESVLVKLIEAAEILLHEKDYDGHGWEEIAGCVRYGKDRLPKLRALAAEYFQHNSELVNRVSDAV